MSDLMMMAGVGAQRMTVRPHGKDLRSTSHTVTCDYLVGRGFRVCSCSGSRNGR